jgi:hypothetical protein
VIKKEAEKIPKYKNLTIEIEYVVTVIIGAAGTISKSLRKYLNNTPGKRDIKELQKKQPH